MTTRRPALRALAALGLAALAAPRTVLAHGTNSHGTPAATPVRREQKPWGIAGGAKAVRRTIAIDMLDTMRFVPDRLQVREGDTVRLRIRNRGKVLHELVIGTREELDKHAALMVKFPEMEHDEPYMAHVPVGTRGELVWLFNRPGDFEFACLIPGHFQAGMRGTITVQRRA